MRSADWIIDVGPGAGEHGGHLVHSGSVAELAEVAASVTRQYLFPPTGAAATSTAVPHRPTAWLRLSGVTRHNLRDLTVELPLGVFTVVTGVSGSGKSTLISQVLAGVVADHLGRPADAAATRSGDGDRSDDEMDENDDSVDEITDTDSGFRVDGLAAIDRLAQVDQRPIGRTPRSNLATYTGMFDAVRKLFAATDEARRRGYGVGRFSFNVDGGRCETCQGEGFVSVELLFLPGTYAPCPVCHGARYNPQTLEITYRGATIAEVLDLTVEQAAEFLADVPAARRSLRTLSEVGLGYLRLGQPATTLSGGEAQRIKLATELQRGRRGGTLYLLDEPTSGLHPADVEVLMRQLHGLVAGGSTVVVVEHDMSVAAGADWVIDLGPGGGDRGGQVVASGPPAEVAASAVSVTAPFLAARLA
jgi:excinuclease ABC subunit A